MDKRRAYDLHKRGAEKWRGLEFHFSFDQWCQWWEDNLGPDWFEKRGKGPGKYVMARYGDRGPYAYWNVKCITHSQNSREQVHPKKLTEAQVSAIYIKLKQQPEGIMNTLAKQFNVSRHAIKDIKYKKTWKRVTDQLD